LVKNQTFFLPTSPVGEADIEAAAGRVVNVAREPVTTAAAAIGEIVAAHGLGMTRELPREVIGEIKPDIVADVQFAGAANQHRGVAANMGIMRYEEPPGRKDGSRRTRGLVPTWRLKVGDDVVFHTLFFRKLSATLDAAHTNMTYAQVKEQRHPGKRS
jgi:hypothetical protein